MLAQVKMNQASTDTF